MRRLLGLSTLLKDQSIYTREVLEYRYVDLQTREK